MDDFTETPQGIVVATAQHAAAISRIYRSVMIDPQIFLDLASPSTPRSDAALQFVKSNGGFLSPPDDADMQMAFQHGFCMVFLQDGEVLGFNRYITHSEMALQVFIAEFQLDASKDYSDGDSFTDWSGSKKLKDHKTLRRVHWIDRQQALIALQAAQAGLQNRATGRLAWTIDSAVSPDHQHLGIGKTLSNRMRSVLKPVTGYLAYRMFEIIKINNKEIVIDNDLSKKTFMNAPSKLFAYTEEDIQINTGIQITVRWNHWLKYFLS